MNDLSKNGKHLSLTENQIAEVAILGSIITFNLLEHKTNESEVYTLKLVEHKRKSNRDELSLNSPIGKNIYKSHVGDILTYTLMSNEFTATILNIETPV